MKSGLHREYMLTKVKCNGCGISFETHSTVPEITVEICSNCHPFYTGKQKLVDTAGRVDKFRARQAAAASKLKPAKAAKVPQPTADPVVEKIEQEFEDQTVDLEAKSDQPTGSDNQAAPAKQADTPDKTES